MDATPPTARPATRIRRLAPELADQIAAGEVVERPASVVKELVENAIDAGAQRVEVDLREAGLERICVVDDGAGIHSEDLELAVTRHATSKLARPSDLVDIVTLGFRGEALASIAAIADLTIETRTRDAKTGVQLRARPGLPPESLPVGVPVGTRIVVARLFANVPARRKFMRSEATEVGHCLETMLRLALVHPEAHLRLVHAGRELLDLPASTLDVRVRAILERRCPGPFVHASDEVEGIGVQVWLGTQQTSARARGGIYTVVRRRVVTDRSLGQIVTTAVRERLGSGSEETGKLAPVACVIVEPPSGTVDVNVHPQKSEVRFSAPQDVYTAVRCVLEQAVAQLSAGTEPPAPARWAGFGAAAATALHTWTEANATSGVHAERRDRSSGAASGGFSRYTLRTRATAADYAVTRDGLRAQADNLRERWTEARHEPDPVPQRLEDRGTDLAVRDEIELLTCLPGPVALMRAGDDVLAIDLPVLRSHLVYQRLREDLGAGPLGAQGLLQPVVVKRTRDDLKLWADAGDALGGLGLVAEPFGDEALIVRAVPAGLRGCLDEPDVGDLVERVLAWLRVRGRRGASEGERDGALQAIAQTRGGDPGPRLARRWCKELRDAGVDLAEVPGIRRWTAAALVRSTEVGS